MKVRLLNTPNWSGAYAMAMLLSLAPSDLTLDEGIAVFTCGGEL